MKIRRFLGLALILALALSMAPAAQAEGNVTLRFSWWGGEERHTNTLNAIKLFEEQNPGIKIEAEYSGFDGYKDKLLTQLTGGTAPDIIQIDQPWLEEMANQGIQLMDLSTAGDQLNYADMDPEFLSQFCTVDGKLLGLPTGMNGLSFFQNTKMLQDAGIEVPEQWTWDGLITAAEALHAQDPSKYLIAHDVGVLAGILLPPYLQQKTGGGYITEDYTLDFTAEDLASYFSWVAKMMEVGGLEPEEEAALYTGKYEQNPKWLAGDFALYTNWSSTYYANVREVGFTDAVQVPVGDGFATDVVTVRPSQILSVNGASANQEAALKFIDFLFNNEDALTALGTCRSIPVGDKARDLLTEKNLIDPTAAAAVDMAMPRTAEPLSAVANNSEVGQIINDSVEIVCYGEMSPEEAAQDCYDQLLDKLDELKSLS